VASEIGAESAIRERGAFGVEAGEAGFHEQFGEPAFAAIGLDDGQMSVMAPIIKDLLPDGMHAERSFLEQGQRELPGPEP
jgi:hypothetical protein